MKLKDLDSYHLLCLVCKCPDTLSSLWRWLLNLISWLSVLITYLAISLQVVLFLEFRQVIAK